MFVRFKYTTTLKEKAHYLWPDSRGRTLDNVSCRQHQSRSFLAYGIAVKAERRMIAKVGRVVCSEEPRLGVAVTVYGVRTSQVPRGGEMVPPHLDQHLLHLSRS
jgi:hypothetical protein